LVPGFSPKILGLFQKQIFNLNENKKEINFIFCLLLYFISIFGLVIAIEI